MTSTRRLQASLWLLVATALASAPALGQDLARGEELFEMCAQCHGDDGAGTHLALAPSIGGFPAWFIQGQLVKFRNGGRGMHFDDLTGMRMRPMSLWLENDADVASVSAYVASLPRADTEPTITGGNPETGKQKYVPCIACHGMNGEGNQALNAPPLAGMSDWYQVEALHKFKAGIRGTNPKDTPGMLMRPMAMTLADEQAVLDVVTYINSLTPTPSN